MRETSSSRRRVGRVPPGGGLADPFAESGEDGLATIAHGPYLESVPIAGLTVAQIRRRFRDRYNIPEDGQGELDGRPVDDDTVIAAGQVLTFMHRANSKGVRKCDGGGDSRGAAVPKVDGLLAALEERSPHLRALSARIAEAEKRVRVARFEGFPDFDLGIGYRVRRNVPGDAVEGDDFVGAGITVRLPVDRRKWNAKVAEAKAQKRRAEATYRGAVASLRARVRGAHAELVRADAEGRLVETGLLPQAEQSLESSRSGYQVGRIDFLALLDSQVSLLRAELRHVRALADRRAAFAALEASAGEKLR